MDDWHDTLTNHKIRYEFSELKCWTAAVLGLIYSEFAFWVNRSVVLPNFFHRSNAYFCSELIDKIFKQDNILLVPRSQYDGIVGPSEFFFSPHLEFVGLTCNKEDIGLLDKEKLAV